MWPQYGAGFAPTAALLVQRAVGKNCREISHPQAIFRLSNR
jgi:hypothetical protein